MATPNHHLGSSNEPGPIWILVVAALGWVLLITVSVLLALGTWTWDDSAPSQPEVPPERPSSSLPTTAPEPARGQLVISSLP